MRFSLPAFCILFLPPPAKSENTSGSHQCMITSIATLQHLELASRSSQLPETTHIELPVPLYAKRRWLHEFATQRRVPYYQDPITNDLVATEWLLTSLGEQNCHHAHERHCPHFRLDEDRQSEGSELEEPCDETSESSDSSTSSTSLPTSSMQQPFSPSTVALKMQSSASKSSNVVSPCLRKHSSPLVSSEIADIEEIRALPRYSQNARMHNRAITSGKDCYRDLCTGCLTFTRPFLSRFPCCGEDCRHCPYGHHRGRVQQGPNNAVSDYTHVIPDDSSVSEDSSVDFSASSSSISSASGV